MRSCVSCHAPGEATRAADGAPSLSFIARDNMDMELANDIAQRRRVDLRAAGHFLQALCYEIGFESEHCLVERREVVDFLHARPMRDEQEPGPAPVVHQPQFAKAEPHHLFAVSFQLCIELKSRPLSRLHGISPAFDEG